MGWLTRLWARPTPRHALGGPVRPAQVFLPAEPAGAVPPAGPVTAAGPRGEITFRDGSTAPLDPAQARELAAIAARLTGR